MKLAVDMAEDGVIYANSFIQIGSGVKKLLRGIHIKTYTHRQRGDLISLLVLNKKRRLKSNAC
jgi:hypothetical protein